MFGVLTLALGGFSCDKKSVAKAPDPGPAVPFEAPAAKPGAPATPESGKPEAAAPEAPKAAPGDRVAELVEKLPSPCGKAESLKRSEGDPSCKSAPFARRLVEKLVSLDAPEDELTQLYRDRFGARDNPSFNLRESPFIGTPNAPVTIVEFYDYGCPHCREAEPLLEKLVADNPRDVVIYFKQYPLRKETTEPARAALAAQKQGKFKEMNKTLFANQGRQSHEELLAYAKELGLDQARFEKDMNDPATTARLDAEKEEAHRAKLEGTPLIFINGRKYHNGFGFDPLSDWVEEELTLKLNR